MHYGSLVFRWSHRLEGLPENSPNLLSREKAIRANISTAAEGKPTITIREAARSTLVSAAVLFIQSSEDTVAGSIDG